MPLSLTLQPFCLVLALITGNDELPPAASGASPPAAASTGHAALTERLVYPIRHGSAADVANVLDKHFKGDAEVQAAPDKSGNALFVRYRPALRDELLKTLSELDRPPRPLAIDVMVVGIARKKEAVPEEETRPRRGRATKAEPVPPLKEEELTGSTAGVIARLEALHGSGELAALRKFHLTGLEYQQTTAQAGHEVSIPSGFTTNQQTGRIAPLIQRRSVGTIVTLTPRVVSDNEILLDIVVRSDGIYVPEDAKPVGEDKNGAPVFLPNVSTINATGKITVKPGQTAILQQLPSDEKGEAEKVFIVVAAELVSGEAKAPAK